MDLPISIVSNQFGRVHLCKKGENSAVYGNYAHGKKVYFLYPFNFKCVNIQSVREQRLPLNRPIFQRKPVRRRWQDLSVTTFRK